MKSILIAASLLLCAMPALAGPDRGVYIGGSTMLTKIGLQDAYDKEVQFKVVEGIIGYRYNSLLGVESRIGATARGENVLVREDPVSGEEDVVEANIDHFESLYYRAELKNDIAKLYMLLGTARMSVTSEFEDGTQVTNTSSGLSYGIGGGLVVGDSFYFNIEAKSLIHTNTDTYFGYGASITLHF